MLSANVSSLAAVVLLMAALLCRPSAGLGGFSSHRSRWGSSRARWGYPSLPSRSLVLEQAIDADDATCSGKACTAAKDCCEGMVCVDVGIQEPGRCRSRHGASLGQPCEGPDDCKVGLVCSGTSDEEVLIRSCQYPSATGAFTKHYNEDCDSSEDCMIHKGLCCQLQKRHRTKPRKACIYFTDERQCIGAVDRGLVLAAIADAKETEGGEIEPINVFG